MMSCSLMQSTAETIRYIHPEEIVIDNVHAPMVQQSIYHSTAACKCSAVRGQPYSAPRLIPELEVMCCPSVYFDISIQTRSAQLAWPLAWTMSAPGSQHIMGLIYPYMVHSMAPSLGSQAALVLNPTGLTHTGTLQTPLVLPS